MSAPFPFAAPLRFLQRPRRGALGAVLLVIGLALAGCTDPGPSAFSASGAGDGDGAAPPRSSPSAPATPGPSGGPPASPAPGGAGGENGTGGTGGNGTGANGTGGNANGTGANGTAGDGNGTDDGPPGDAPAVVWPPLNEARVRPGVQIVVAGSQCTSNFLFRSASNGSLYLGLAAHCVDGSPIGATATVRDIAGLTAFQGRVAYSSWRAIGFEPAPSSVGDDVHPHDFALVELPLDQVGIIHPAVLQFGGPTALADYDAVAVGSRVIVYGGSGLYPRPQPLDEQEGVVLRKGSASPNGSPGHFVDTHMVVAPVPGDSGSGLMTKDGRALGALSTISAGTPYGVWWRYSSVPHALGHLDSIGWDLEVQTWDLIDAGLLP